MKKFFATIKIFFSQPQKKRLRKSQIKKRGQ